MSIKVFSASGYISGSATQDEGCTLTGLTIKPGSAAGTVKISQGINGADAVVVAEFTVIEDLASYHIPIHPGILSSLRTFITLAGTALEVIVQYN